MAKTFEYAASLDAAGSRTAEIRSSRGEAWTPEHLLLAGLMHCTLKSLRFHADRRGLSASGGATAEGVVTRREEDGRFALASVGCGLDVRLEPGLLEAEALHELLDLAAERDQASSAPSTAKPRYEWRVNGDVVPR